MFCKKKHKKKILSDPRHHHYTLGHIAFRMFCDSDPLHFFHIMATKEKNDVVSMLWEKVCEECKSKEKTDIGPEDINISTYKIAGCPTVLIKMPEAKAIAEAIFIAVILTTDLSNSESSDIIEYRYFVLEQGVDQIGESRTVFCEWTQDTHLNMGDGCNPDMDSFIKLISSKI